MYEPKAPIADCIKQHLDENEEAISRNLSNNKTQGNHILRRELELITALGVPCGWRM